MTIINIQKPRFDTHEAAQFLNFSSQTLRISRVTGLLAGSAAPMHRKVGRKVIYDYVILETWLNQFENQQHTGA
jgi:hypothetical protein